MPHLTVHVLEDQLSGREERLIGALTEAVVTAYGEWARKIAVVRLVGVPAGRWGVGGRPVADAAPAVTVAVEEAAFARPERAEFSAALVAAVTDALAAVLGERVRAAATVDLVGTPDGRSAVGGVLI